jgi:hypothetical protein
MFRRLAIALALIFPTGVFVARALPLPRHEPVPPSPSASPSLLSTDPIPTQSHRSRQPKQRGVALGLFAEDVSFSYAALLREVAALGASHVALIIPLYQTNGASTQLHLHTRLSPSLETVADTIREAQRMDLEVTLFPIVRLSNPRTPNEWRGTLAPANRDAWFASYGQWVGDLASLATLTGATRLVIGSELSTLDGDLPRWKELIELVRAVYSGTLVYSSNWDHYQDTRLFELVDEMGVVGYFDLRRGSDPTDVQAMATRWRQIGRQIEASLARFDKPFVFTEVGYRSRKGATASPWDENPGGAPDLDEQQRGFEAFRLAWTAPESTHPPFDGLYVWNWYGYGGAGTTSYTPRGKPAVETVKKILRDLEVP